ncbi:hypothetical protein VSR34_27795 [Paraburkholderia sp. JHI2823]|uniref:hypothetical protein n=1 Tax=Paraburkholderia sp. JHI2823 TaxID=3112960 RepID=UPI003179BCD2
MTIEELVYETQAVMDAAAKVLRAGAWLIRSGYGRLMLLPYLSPVGTWRCEFHPPGRPSQAFFRYTSASGSKYLRDHCGGSIRRNASPRALAEAIMVSVSDATKDACRGETLPETLTWLERLDAALDAGFLPSAFHEYTSDFSQWDLISTSRGNGDPMPPQPGYVRPGSEPSVVDIDWRAGEAAWNEIAGSERATINLAMLADDDRCYELADRVRLAFDATKHGVDAQRLLRAIVGELSRQP